VRKRRLIIACVVPFFLAGILSFVWIALDWPPVRFVLKYGLTPGCAPTGQTLTVEGVEFVEIGPGVARIGSTSGREATGSGDLSAARPAVGRSTDEDARNARAVGRVRARVLDCEDGGALHLSAASNRLPPRMTAQVRRPSSLHSKRWTLIEEHTSGDDLVSWAYFGPGRRIENMSYFALACIGESDEGSSNYALCMIVLCALALTVSFLRRVRSGS